MKYYLPHNKKELLIHTMDRSQELYAGLKKVRLKDPESRMMIAGGWRLGEMGTCGQRAETSSYKMNQIWGSNVQHGDYS